MNYKVFILPSAFEDLNKAENFYSLISFGLGKYCIDSLLVDIDSLEFYATTHPTAFGYYRMLSRRFPFAIYYKTLKNRVVVTAVLDTRSSPKKHSSRFLSKK